MNLSSIQKFSEEVPKDDKLKELDVIRFRPNIIGELLSPILNTSTTYLTPQQFLAPKPTMRRPGNRSG